MRRVGRRCAVVVGSWLVSASSTLQEGDQDVRVPQAHAEWSRGRAAADTVLVGVVVGVVAPQRERARAASAQNGGRVVCDAPWHERREPRQELRVEAQQVEEDEDGRSGILETNYFFGN